MSKYETQRSKSNLKLVAANKPTVVAGGHMPYESMQPGRYIAKCVTARFVEKGKDLQAHLFYEIAEGPHVGTTLRQWLTVNEIQGAVSAGTKYFEHCRMALAREIKRGDNLDPEVVFPGKTFLVEVGYSTRHNKRFDPANAQTKKGDRDFLRIHHIVEAL